MDIRRIDSGHKVSPGERNSIIIKLQGNREISSFNIILFCFFYHHLPTKKELTGEYPHYIT
jgi:hypothetical protein